MMMMMMMMMTIPFGITPVITGATGTTSKSFAELLSNIPGKHEFK